MPNIQALLTWPNGQEEEVPLADRPDDILRSHFENDGTLDYWVIRVNCGTDAYLLDNHSLMDYEVVRECVAMGQVSHYFILFYI